ncbi:phage baseplate assembly protein V [Bengtsoniella intestinalis]|uniref:phage baseplate assembly protein V n=1 Tax=Bengtsoniella intestinalis TaxID=3073143 RepID=UPI00391FA87F
MALVDIIEELTATQVHKTETGDNRIFGVVVGVVVSNYQKTDNYTREGRVQVKIPVFKGTSTEVVKWARVAIPYGGGDYGMYFLPEVGDQVLLSFEGGLIDCPFVIGCLPKDSDNILTQDYKTTPYENNYVKKIRTKGKQQIVFDDTADAETLTLKGYASADGTLTNHIIMSHSKSESEETHDVAIRGNDSIAIEAVNDSITITAKKKLTIKVGSEIVITLNGENGNIDITKGKNLTVNVSGNMNMKSSGTAVFQGAQSATLGSDGPTKVEGSSVST